MNRRGFILLSIGFMFLLVAAVHSLALILVVDFFGFPGVGSSTLNLNHLIEAVFNVAGLILVVIGICQILYGKTT
jgi:hypothetical protein